MQKVLSKYVVRWKDEQIQNNKDSTLFNVLYQRKGTIAWTKSATSHIVKSIAPI